MTVEDSRSGRVFVVGSVNVDTVLRLRRHPSIGETVHALDASTAPGGKGGNQAVAARHAGAPTSIVGRIGSDDAGRQYLAHLRGLGIDCSLLQVSPGASGQATVMVNAGGENSIIVLKGANAQVAVADIHALAARVRAGDVVSTQFELPEEVVRAALEVAEEAGAFSILNPSPWLHRPELVALADLVVVNALEADQLERAGGNLDALCVTLGAGGARWGEVRVSAPRITPVDTTGAGDAFTGTLAAAIARGDDRRTALSAAVVAATAACQHPHAQQWATTAEPVQRTRHLKAR